MTNNFNEVLGFNFDVELDIINKEIDELEEKAEMILARRSFDIPIEEIKDFIAEFSEQVSEISDREEILYNSILD